ncbi:glutathione S-transferase N-terminal domain-containing protein [Amphiplicatus metriothermophilus]|uniref:Glutathione S-transferase, N-terminal domain n=1 Tax=Amphiplicatus metriothermophilus TaxID=1519374 RepID=A0A239PZP6_9PROT|nr:glutathione S-transferase N-terminal domain-containing protein [Amphiplicatus metriothermophilus]MBB5518233.1 glutathione S-transferase [Amphiplicatus metriothermophilus]SNT75436.1 Glutathione S-transferase, N-terminal domain [Amphiplicatus metriothermophilus]
MPLTLYYHPLSPYCWKALIAFYEGDVPFTPRVVDLMDETDAAVF